MRHPFLCALGGAVVLGVGLGQARGGMLYDWANDPAGTRQMISDAAGDQASATTSRDIVALWYARDSVNHYFRMDLSAAPAVNYAANSYSIQIDDIAGAGGSVSNTGYVGAGLSGIDELVMSHYTAGMAEFTYHHLHHVLAPTPGVDTGMLEDVGGMVDVSENGGATLQWAVPLAALNAGPFVIYGVTNNIDEPLTYDITSGISAPAVPEPATLALLGLGVVGAALRRRR